MTLEYHTMQHFFRRLWTDEGGMILSSEVVLVGTILVIGAIAGLTSVQYAVTNELNDTARAYDSYHSYGDDGSSGNDYAVFDSEGRREVACDAF